MRPRAFHAIVSLAIVSLFSVGIANGQVSGVVRDQNRQPVAGVTVTLTGPASAAKGNATTDAFGGYRFIAPAVGDYTLTAVHGDQSASSLVHVTSPSVEVKADITLRASPADASRPPLQFQAAGIRGLIDPGGYSASANAAAATGVVRGIADIRRTDRAAASANWPCSLEPQLKQAAADHPDQADAVRKLGEFYTAHGQPAKAVPLLEHALQLDPADDAASRDLATARLQLGEFADARRLIMALLAREARSQNNNADEAEAYQLLARADEGLGVFTQAAEDYRAADREAPSEESLFGLGYELVLSGAPADALAVFTDGASKYPRSASMRIGQGTAQLLLGHADEAVRSFLAATDIDSTDSRAYSFLAAASSVSSVDSGEVRKQFEHFLEQNPDSAAANYFYAHSLSHASGSPDDDLVEAHLRRAIQLDPTLAKAHLEFADLLERQNKFAAAVPEYEAAVRLDPSASEAHYRLALAYKRAGDTARAAYEMQVFQESKARDGNGKESISIAQFISVMDAPGQHASEDLRCSATR